MAAGTAGDGYYKVYEEYSKTLRTWFVAYGIGAPVLLLNNEVLRKAVIGSGASTEIAIVFLAGVAMQVALASVNKATAWILYAESEVHAKPKAAHKPAKRTWYQELADRISEQFWIDFAVDLLTGVAFVLGTLRVFLVASHAG